MDLIFMKCVKPACTLLYMSIIITIKAFDLFYSILFYSILFSKFLKSV